MTDSTNQDNQAPAAPASAPSAATQAPDAAQQALNDVKTSLDKLFGTVVSDELVIVRPLSDGYLTSVVANPSPSNLAAQSLAFEAQAIALLPNMEAAAAKDTAASLKALLDLEADRLTAQLAGSTASTAAIAIAAQPTA